MRVVPFAPYPDPPCDPEVERVAAVLDPVLTSDGRSACAATITPALATSRRSGAPDRAADSVTGMGHQPGVAPLYGEDCSRRDLAPS
jgi:hypothetical protein